jgi:hypothetical protein
MFEVGLKSASEVANGIVSLAEACESDAEIDVRWWVLCYSNGVHQRAPNGNSALPRSGVGTASPGVDGAGRIGRVTLDLARLRLRPSRLRLARWHS